MHSVFDELQTMLIRMPANYCYDYIRDDLEGEISFIVVQGLLLVHRLDLSGFSMAYELSAGDALYIKRNVFRKTMTGDAPCLYYENISGGYHPEKRQHMIDS